MDKFRIIGGRPLEGRVQISGAKNSALPCMAAALLTSETVTLHNLPYVRDIITMRRLLEDLGCEILMPELRTLKVSAAKVEVFEAPYELVKTMRASVLALGPLLARFGEARVSLPGGCAIGQRPIDLHLAGFEKLGATVAIEGGELDIVNCDPEALAAVLDKLEETGVRIERPNAFSLRVGTDNHIRCSDVTTLPHPGFPTDMQAQYMTLMTLADGISVITETIFE